MIIKDNQKQSKQSKKQLKCNQKIIIKIKTKNKDKKWRQKVKTKSKHKMEKEVGDVHENYEN